MVRFFGFCAGLLFVFVLMVGVFIPRDDPSPDPVAAIHLAPEKVHWSQDGPLGLGVFGTFDRAQLQRGYHVYANICAGCHGLEQVAFRNLEDIGFSEAQVKALALERDIADIDGDTGEQTTRPGLPSDRFPSPYENDVAAAAANNNAAPPDLSLITKARHNGPRYLYSLLVGYEKEAPEGFEVPDGLHFNPYFDSVNIAMAQPLYDDMVDYADGTPATIDQMARDVTAFLQWAAEPETEVRRRMGVGVMIFLAILTLLAWMSYRRVWAGVEH